MTFVIVTILFFVVILSIEQFLRRRQVEYRAIWSMLLLFVPFFLIIHFVGPDLSFVAVLISVVIASLTYAVFFADETLP